MNDVHQNMQIFTAFVVVGSHLSTVALLEYTSLEEISGSFISYFTLGVVLLLISLVSSFGFYRFYLKKVGVDSND